MNEPVPLNSGPLLQQLQDDTSGLSNRMLLSLAMAGLRVRLLRSAVTILSVVLAIAFLTYMGIAGSIERNVASSVVELERTFASNSDGDRNTSGTSSVTGALNDARVKHLNHEQAQDDANRMRFLLRRNGTSVETALSGSSTNTWLITMALLTCTVGVWNAMLMSVTERFREIGTMKCLGAVDSMVIKLFLFESAFQGLVGAIAGVILGLVVALTAAVLQFERFGWTRFPVDQLGKVVCMALIVGALLAVIGAAYPAFIAARMKPVDALRTEE